MLRQFNRKRIVFSANGAGTTRYQQAKNQVGINFILYTKFNSKWTQDLNVRAKTIKLLEKSIAVNLNDLALCNGLLDMTLKAWVTKEKNRYIEFYRILKTLFLQKTLSRT